MYYRIYYRYVYSLFLFLPINNKYLRDKWKFPTCNIPIIFINVGQVVGIYSIINKGGHR